MSSLRAFLPILLGNLSEKQITTVLTVLDCAYFELEKPSLNFSQYSLGEASSASLRMTRYLSIYRFPIKDLLLGEE